MKLEPVAQSLRCGAKHAEVAAYGRKAGAPIEITTHIGIFARQNPSRLSRRLRSSKDVPDCILHVGTSCSSRLLRIG